MKINCRISHNIKAKTDSPLPELNENSLVYINGEIAYEKYTEGEKDYSIPRILTKQVIRLDNNKETADLEQLFKGN